MDKKKIQKTKNRSGRQLSMAWWNSLTLEEKFYKTIDANEVIVGDNTRHPDSLTGREITDVYNFHKK